MAQERIEVNQALAAQGAPATEGSPQAAVEFATGLDRDGVEAALARIEASNPLPAIQRAINEYRTSVEQGGRISNQMLSPIIRNIKLVVENNQIWQIGKSNTNCRRAGGCYLRRTQGSRKTGQSAFSE